MIYGHSHVPELITGQTLGDNLPDIIGNCGSWLKEEKRRHNTYILINEDSVVLKELGVDVRDEDRIEWK